MSPHIFVLVVLNLSFDLDLVKIAKLIYLHK